MTKKKKSPRLGTRASINEKSIKDEKTKLNNLKFNDTHPIRQLGCSKTRQSRSTDLLEHWIACRGYRFGYDSEVIE